MSWLAAEYGPFAQTVSIAGCLMAAAVAVRRLFRGRARWAPVEEDIPSGAEKVGGLLTAVGIAALWYWMRGSEQAGALTRVMIWLAGGTLVSLLAYGFVVVVYTYVRVVTRNGVALEQKVGGGFMLTAAAKDVIRKKKKTVQEVYKGAAYDKDLVWTRLGLAGVHVMFIFASIMLTAAGTLALASAALLVANKI